MKELQAFSHVVILQFILNPAFLGCLLALGPKGISRFGLRGNQRLPLIRHIFAHLSGYQGIEKALVTAQLDTNAPASGSRVDQDQFLAAVCSRARRFGALLRPQLRR